ncbi:NACHT, LRR and PYD domains-containing protein 3-like [Gastrophryne carolinensis]
MAGHPKCVINSEVQRFQQQLSGYTSEALTRITEHFTDDLIYILEVLDYHALLRELKSQYVLDADIHLNIINNYSMECLAYLPSMHMVNHESWSLRSTTADAAQRDQDEFGRIPRNTRKRKAFPLELQELIQNNVIEVVPPHFEGQRFYSHVFLVHKPSEDYRMILNLKKLNHFIRYKKFRMSEESLLSFLENTLFLKAGSLQFRKIKSSTQSLLQIPANTATSDPKDSTRRGQRYLHRSALAKKVLVRRTEEDGENLEKQILLEENGYPLIPELRDIQETHKQCLLEKTQKLVEHRPPGTTLEPKEFYINERYVNLFVVSTDQFRQRPQHELVKSGRQHEKCLKKTQTGLEHISPTRLFCWCRELHCEPKTVIVSGVPGIGKTTLMQKIVHDWVNEKLYQRFTFVFFSRFRELNKLTKVSLEEMILYLYPYLRSQIRSILEDPEKLLFIFDGLDESLHDIDFRSSELCTDPTRRVEFGAIIVSLIRQHLLKGCSILITSRPTKLASVNINYFQRLTEVMGFQHEDRQIYFEKFFGNEEDSRKAFHYVQENDTLYTFCYIPSYCWILCKVLSMCLKAGTNHDQITSTLPKTVTQLFAIYVSNILTNHHQSNDDVSTAHTLLKSIGHIAEYGVMNHFIVFDKHDLESFKVRNDLHLFSCFLLESGHPPDVDYSFLHLTVQEFFAALYHFINYNHNKLHQTLNQAKALKDGRAEMLLRFLCGLSDKSTGLLLESQVGSFSRAASEHVIEWLRQQIPEEQSSTTQKRELLNIFYCLLETRNTFLVLQCFRKKNIFDFSEILLTPLDCTVLAFILEVCQNTENLLLNACKIPSEGFGKLVPALRSVKNLSLKYNDLTESCVLLASGIKENQTLRKLNLSNSSLQGPHFCGLMTALVTSRIEELLLMEAGLTESSCTHLASGISNNHTLRTLDLSGNSLEGPHFSVLTAALKTSRIEKLLLKNSHLTDSSCSHLASGIKDNKNLKMLDLSLNKLEGPHFGELMEALPTSRVEELVTRFNNVLHNIDEILRDGDLTNTSCIQMASGIKNNQSLRKLDLTINNLEGPHLSDLMAVLPTSSIKELLLERNNLSNSSCIHLVPGIQSNEYLKVLNLYGNELAGEHFKDLMAALTTSKIEELILQYNRLTDISCIDLAFGIKDNQTLRKLDLSWNNLVGPHFSDMMKAFTTSTIKELILRKIGLTAAYAQHLETLSNCKNLQILDVRRNRISDVGSSSIRDLVMKSSSLKILQIAENHGGNHGLLASSQE